MKCARRIERGEEVVEVLENLLVGLAPPAKPAPSGPIFRPSPPVEGISYAAVMAAPRGSPPSTRRPHLRHQLLAGRQPQPPQHQPRQPHLPPPSRCASPLRGKKSRGMKPPLHSPPPGSPPPPPPQQLPLLPQCRQLSLPAQLPSPGMSTGTSWPSRPSRGHGLRGLHKPRPL